MVMVMAMGRVTDNTPIVALRALELNRFAGFLAVYEVISERSVSCYVRGGSKFWGLWSEVRFLLSQAWWWKVEGGKEKMKQRGGEGGRK